MPCAEPRYLTMRRRRVAVSSFTRWLKTTTKSATYSSRPWRVMCRSPLSPVTIAVTPRSASHWKRRLISARMMTSSLNAEKRTSMVSSTTRLAPTASISAPSRTKRPSRSYSPVSSISLRSMRMWSRAMRPCSCSADQVEALGGEVGLEVARGLLEADEQPRLAVLLGAIDEEAHGEDGLAAAGGAGDEGHAAHGQAALGDLVEALDPSRDLGERAGRSKLFVGGWCHCSSGLIGKMAAGARAGPVGQAAVATNIRCQAPAA